MKPIALTELVAARIEAKRAEDAAIAERRRIDGQIASLLKGDTIEGTESRKLEDLGVKVSVTYSLTRKVDDKALAKSWDSLSPEQQAAFNWKASVSLTGLRKLDETGLYAASKFIETSEASPSVKVELI
jgi:hypothetical protein